MVLHPDTATPSSSHVAATASDDPDDPPVPHVTRDPETGRAYPDPTSLEPDFVALAGQLIDGAAVCTDECFPLEPVGVCEHGHPTWLRRLSVV